MPKTTTEPGPKPISDKKLVTMAQAREKLRLQIKDLETQKEALDKAILGELTRRGTKSIDHGGVKVTSVAQSWTSYSFEQLREALGKQAGRYRVDKVDVAKLSRAVQAKKVPTSIIDDITQTGTHSPYVSVSSTAP